MKVKPLFRYFLSKNGEWTVSCQNGKQIYVNEEMQGTWTSFTPPRGYLFSNKFLEIAGSEVNRKLVPKKIIKINEVTK